MNSTIDGLDDSRSRSFVNLWPVAEAYQVIDGYVCALVGGKVIKPGALHRHPGCRPYLPMAHSEIPSAFAKAATGEESDILTFVHHYGLVGYDRAWRFPDEQMGARMWLQGQHDTAAFQHGDPFTWVVAHARTVKLLLHLIGTLDDPAAIQGAIDELRVRHSSPNGTHEESIEYLAAERGYLCPSSTQIVLMPPRQAALFIVSTVLEKNLTGVSRTLFIEEQDDGRPGFTSVFLPCNLLDCVYWHLADAALGGWVRRCANPRCGDFFVAKSAKVKYCPALLGYKGVSPCMNRHKQQKHRDEARKRQDAAHRPLRTRMPRKGRT